MIESKLINLKAGEWVEICPGLKGTLCKDNRYMLVLGEGEKEERYFKSAALLQPAIEVSLRRQEAPQLVYSEIGVKSHEKTQI